MLRFSERALRLDVFAPKSFSALAGGIVSSMDASRLFAISLTLVPASGEVAVSRGSGESPRKLG